MTQGDMNSRSSRLMSRCPGGAWICKLGGRIGGFEAGGGIDGGG
jgi:hypothetical protein